MSKFKADKILAEKVRNKERAAKGAPKGNKDKSVMPATGAAVKKSSARTAGSANKGASVKTANKGAAVKTANKSAAGKNSQGRTADKKALKSAPVSGARENAKKAAEKQLPAQVVSREKPVVKRHGKPVEKAASVAS